MPKFKLTIEYDGGPFAGWQRQSDQPSVQGVLEAAAAAVGDAEAAALLLVLAAPPVAPPDSRFRSSLAGACYFRAPMPNDPLAVDARAEEVNVE